MNCDGVDKFMSVPLVYMLLPDKTKKTYKSALDIVKDSVGDYYRDEIICDFESAFLSSFRKNFPTTHIKGCHFHFGQCIFRNVQKLGYQALYADDLNFNTCVELLVSLSFVPIDDVVYAYE